MFSKEEKQIIAAEVERILLELNHPEMPKEKPKFKLHVDGAASWSWADIEPNWVYQEKGEPENTNTWNEKAREYLKTQAEGE